MVALNSYLGAALSISPEYMVFYNAANFVCSPAVPWNGFHKDSGAAYAFRFASRVVNAHDEESKDDSKRNEFVPDGPGTLCFMSMTESILF